MGAATFTKVHLLDFFSFFFKKRFYAVAGSAENLVLRNEEEGGGVFKQIPCRTTTHFYIFPSDCCKARIVIFHFDRLENHVCPVCSAKWA